MTFDAKVKEFMKEITLYVRTIPYESRVEIEKAVRKLIGELVDDIRHEAITERDSHTAR